MTVRVVVADDHPVVRRGLLAILAAEPDLEVVGDCANGEQAVALVRELCPDVVLMDLRMPVMDGVAATAAVIKVSTARVVVLTTFDSDRDILRTVESWGHRLPAQTRTRR